MVLRTEKSKTSNKERLFQQFSGAPKINLLVYSFVLLLVVISVLHIRSAFFAQISENQGQQLSTFSFALNHPDALAQIARDEHLRNANLPSAFQLYQKALGNFVLHLPSWFGITEVLNDQGKTEQAVNALEFVHTHYENNVNISWSKAMLASSLGQEKILAENLIWLAENHPRKKKEVMGLAVLSWPEPKILMNKFGKPFYGDILLQYQKNDEFDKAWTVWKKLSETHSIELDIALQYTNYLMGKKAYALASKVWSETIGPDHPLIYNGDFESPILGSGFGWRITKRKSVSWEQGGFGGGLRISFDGSENISFQLSQILTLAPGKYVFSGTIETDNLTTDQLPYWNIQGVECIGLHEESEMVLPNQHVTEFILPFVVPENCELIRLAFLRKQSFHFDNKFGGTVTVNKLSIQREGTGSAVSQKSDISISDMVEMSSPRNQVTTKIKINQLDIKQDD